ncbi:DUF2812 domain-containing protein [Neobacillus sp. MER 74]|uniref:DUF2812 domain-containing protein n=1 Tax=Neobacillus sp. MER 74 TaxID=2939566 RepID=UPI0020406381|nr:DUF2812 domain-containing protein [Neobacillus sp. MER 74]MCM3118844.1 DUF2812 domain-containing protein [Neobacillus sp. MER 74]
MIKVFRPFWSYDVKKTEKWLSTMAENGYQLVKLNRWTRCFFFRQDEPKMMTYRIGFEKMQGMQLPSSLLNDNWVKVTQNGNWYFLTNEEHPQQIKTSPVRDGIIKHNRIIMFIFTAIFVYLTAIALFNLSMMGMVLFANVPVEVEPSPLWSLTYTALAIAIGVYILSLYSIIKIKKSNRDLSGGSQREPQRVKLIGERWSKEKEKKLKRSGQMVVKRKFGWMFSPDKLEIWLEKMEELGFNLYRIGSGGKAFYFIKGNPRKVRYCAIYSNLSNESFFDFIRETEWGQVYISNSSLQNWTIWSREYTDNEKRPQIFSENSQQLQHARRVAIGYTMMFLPLAALYIFMCLFSNHLPKINLAIYMLGIFIWCYYIVRIWLYYIRQRKQKEVRSL